MKITESQSTKVGCGLVMPVFLVLSTLRRVMNADCFPVYGNYQMLPKDSMKFKRMADDMGVSENMLMIRLRRLKLLDYRPIEEYLEIIGLRGAEENIYSH